ncbi:MAG: ParA family protein [Pseudomonadota bacterium]
MGTFIAVANRKGGVGKSTISVMLAHAFAVWGGQKVLLIDLDAQSNSSLILIGGTHWIDTQRNSKNIAAYLEDRLYKAEPISNYVVDASGDIVNDANQPPALTLLPGSLNFEDMQDELISSYSKGNTPFRQAKRNCAHHFRQALSFAAPLADIIIMDCAPGLSNATSAALKLADKVVVPFRPDAVSELAIDKISTIIEEKPFDAVTAMPMETRKYIGLANYVRPGGRDRVFVETIAFNHPVLHAQMPLSQDLANAFFFADEPQTLDEKYGGALLPMRAVHDELVQKLTNAPAAA